MTLTGVSKFEQFFRAAASLDVDKDDLKRYSDFVFGEIYDLLIIGQAVAKANNRDVLERHDLPITKGLQERIHEFEEIDESIELEPILDHLAARPQLDVTISEDAEAHLAEIVGGLSVALARSFRIIDPRVTNPQTDHWDRAFRLFELLM
jgi:Domain of unknown function (DUF1931)